MIPLRVYVADDSDNIFDVSGIKNIENFTGIVIKPLFDEKYKKHIFFGAAGVSTKFYSEDQLIKLLLQSNIDEERIKNATTVIKHNKKFLAAIPKRQEPHMPAYQAAKFVYGRCAPYAEALKDITGIPAIAMIATKFSPMYEGTKRSQNGYIHSLVLHSGDRGEDSWGRQPIERIAKKFGVLEFHLSIKEHNEVVKNLKKNSPEKYCEAYGESQILIKKFRLKL